MKTDLSLVNQLKIEVAKEFGQPISTQREILLLKDDIHTSISSSIGFNTLRRFFGNLESTKPQIATLDSLSKYVGFKNFTDFCKQFNKHDEWYTWKRMNAIEVKKELTVDDTNWLNSIKQKAEYPVMISNLIKSYILRHAYKNLETIFTSKCLIDLKYEDQMKIGNTLGILFRTLNKEELNRLTFLLKHYNFRNFALYLFVDYSSFQGYYGLFIDKTPVSELDYEEHLFHTLITNYKNWLLNKTVKPIAGISENKTIHPILKGRFYGYQIIAQKQSIKAIKNEIIVQSKKINSKISFFFEIIPALILTKDIKTLEQIFDKYYKSLFDVKYWSQKDEESLNKIGYALVLVHKNKTEQANTFIKSIDVDLLTDSYQSYVQLFYCIAEYQIIKHLQTDSVSKLDEIEKRYVRLVEETGFKRFTKGLLKNYF